MMRIETENESILAIRATQREYGLEGDWNLNGESPALLCATGCSLKVAGMKFITVEL
jgi:hypothetical protein